MNGPMIIYRLEPLYEIPQKLLLPDCIYEMKNPVACVTNISDHTDDEKEVLASIMDKKALPELALLEGRWNSVLQQLTELEEQVQLIRKSVAQSCQVSGCTLLDSALLNNLKVFQGAVINASPSNPPYSLLLLKHLCRSSLPILLNTYVHSSISSLPDYLNCFTEQISESNNTLKLVLIWKAGITDAEIVMNPIKQQPIRGEVNILRFLSRAGLKLLQYPSDSIIDTIQKDAILDVCHRLLHVTNTKERASLFRNLNGKLGKSSYFGGENINICDISAWSALKQIQINAAEDLSQSLAKCLQVDFLMLLHPADDAAAHMYKLQLLYQGHKTPVSTVSPLYFTFTKMIICHSNSTMCKSLF